jgi:hypothetical protein
MAQLNISDLDPGVPPYDLGTLFEIDVPTLGTRRATLGDLIDQILDAGEITLGTTAVPLGDTITTLAGLTLSSPAITGTVTLPDTGQISSAGELGLGGVPTAKLALVGAYTTTNTSLARISGTFASSGTSNQTALTISPTFAPSGVSLTQILALNFVPVINSTAFIISNYIGIISGLTLGASFGGVITNFFGFQAQDPLVSGGSITNVYQYNAAVVTNGNNAAAGTFTNRQFRAQGITAGAAGGILNNRGVEITMPSGGASSGTANNRGIFITGNGGVAAGGTVNNHAIYSDSTAMSLLTGGLTVGTTTLLTSSVALSNGAGAGAGTISNAPAAGNPTKWIPINDNGTIRHIPSW